MNTVLLLFMIYCATALAVPEWDNIEYENKEIVEDENKEIIEDESSVIEVEEHDDKVTNMQRRKLTIGDIDISEGSGDRYCVYIRGTRKGCLTRERVCRVVIGDFRVSCTPDEEEKYEGKCYKKCSLLTEGKYPKRRGGNTCTTVDSCPEGHEIYNGKCYKKCKQGYSVIYHGSLCWGICSFTCGKGYHRWKFSPLVCFKGKKACRNKVYHRGKGVLPYKSLTEGDKPCKGFAVDKKGECPKTELASKFNIKC